MDTDILSVQIYFSQLTVVRRVDFMRYLWSSKPFPASYCLATVVWIFPLSVNMSGLYNFPGWCFALGRCTIHLHMQSSLTLTSILESCWIFHNIHWWSLVVQNCYLRCYLCAWRVGCCWFPYHAFLCLASCLNVGLACANQCFPCGMPHQNISRVDWHNNIYFNFLFRSFLMSWPYLVPTWCSNFYHDVLTWSAADLWP